MRERDKHGKLIGSVSTTAGLHLSPLRCAVQRASNRVTWSVGQGTMKMHDRKHATRIVEPMHGADPAFYMVPRKPRKLRKRIVKAV